MKRWETAQHHLASTAQVADENGHRYMAVRSSKNSREFLAKIDGKSIGKYPSMTAAKEALNKMEA